MDHIRCCCSLYIGRVALLVAGMCAAASQSILYTQLTSTVQLMQELTERGSDSLLTPSSHWSPSLLGWPSHAQPCSTGDIVPRSHWMLGILLQDLTGRGSDSPLTAVSHWSPGSSGGRHMRSASAAASLGGVAAGMVSFRDLASVQSIPNSRIELTLALTAQQAPLLRLPC